MKFLLLLLTVVGVMAIPTPFNEQDQLNVLEQRAEDIPIMAREPTETATPDWGYGATWRRRNDKRYVCTPAEIKNGDPCGPYRGPRLYVREHDSSADEVARKRSDDIDLEHRDSSETATPDSFGSPWWRRTHDKRLCFKADKYCDTCTRPPCPKIWVREHDTTSQENVARDIGE
ncbi:hypothetical protein TREMEDRAFT_66240 [Tremella mesenterica DSM 1558]|uniref:uncharacterized protein n=1 Tax=Tremella mesenterica (strain ATCC 24925 / CBS 8224 / DSM 1558 / NBRC 9311 / NRRL Y-6157 / RJB 2259-6 / UBC 559-6) TaxID=578456 RepID=UPI00032C9FB3|nr:uncharacterized protein TREMEDRAFT_66240 [Tremella mesenterica DSM 1558]EIW65873.1 hypothetical protein TREMEDRAFT_66240 [Tremella mesenterica DSM 1558]